MAVAMVGSEGKNEGVSSCSPLKPKEGLNGPPACLHTMPRIMGGVQP